MIIFLSLVVFFPIFIVTFFFFFFQAEDGIRDDLVTGVQTCALPISAILHLPLMVAFHLARVAGAFALMAAAWLMICHFIEDRTARRFAFFFCAVGLGWGLVIEALGRPVIFGNVTDTLDWRMPELSAFSSVLALPNFAWSGVFAATGIALTFLAIQRGSLLLGVLAGLCWLGQASIHPQMPILMGGATAVALILRPASPRGWLAAAIAFAIPAPYILYSYLAFVGNPEVQRWTFHSKNALPPESVSLFFAVAAQPQYNVPTAFYDGLSWLGNEPAGRVLAMPGVGLYVPAYSGDTVYVGHYDETFDYLAKTQTAYDVLTGKADLGQFIQENHIRYVVWTADLQTSPPSALGPPAYDTPTFKIWKLY